MTRVVDEIVDYVKLFCPVTDFLTELVPPLALVRLSRGGKTLTLVHAFLALKSENYRPIFISFNGSGHSHFQRMKNETDSAAILRLIALQLGEYTADQALLIRVNEKELDEYLGDNVVLLIDELNQLSDSIDGEAAKLLRRLFLDRANRYLIFSSHFPLNLEAKNFASTYLGRSGISKEPSKRAIITLNMSLASSLLELQQMSRLCEGLTEAKAAWLGYIPSLVYISIAAHSSLTQRMSFDIPCAKKSAVLKAFIDELLNGNARETSAQYFKTFASVGQDDNVSYPLGQHSQKF